MCFKCWQKALQRYLQGSRSLQDVFGIFEGGFLRAPLCRREIVFCFQFVPRLLHTVFEGRFFGPRCDIMACTYSLAQRFGPFAN